jgi:hypothetical protein
MNNTDSAELLATLRDIHEPLPPEAGWPWVLIAIALAVILVIMLWLKRKKHKPSIIEQQIEAARGEPSFQALTRLARLLRKYAPADAQNENKQPTGEAWLHHLDSHFKTDYFSQDTGKIFGDALYKKPKQHLDIDALCNQLQKLFKKHGPTTLC